MAWLGLGGTLVWNYVQYRRGKLTICAATRRVLPKPVFLGLAAGGFGSLVVHVIKGYQAP